MVEHCYNVTMRIVYFTQLFYPVIFGGGEYIFYLIAKEMAKKGHDIHVITQRLDNTSEFEISDEIKIHRVGSPFVYSGTLPPTIKHNLTYLMRSISKGNQIIKQNKSKVDIIHSNTYVPALSGQICSKLHRIPHIVTFHDVYQASNDKFWRDWMSKQRESNIPFYASSLARMVEKIIMRLNVSAMHTVSETSKDDLTRFGVKKKILVIPNGLNLSSYDLYSSDVSDVTKPTAVFVGRLVFYKNIEVVINAFKKVVKNIPTAKLVIIGDGPHKDFLIDKAKPIKDNVIFTGRISHSEKVRYLRSASFMVFPSLIEGFGIAIIEGFACHKPVLVSNVRPMSDIVKDGFTGHIIASFEEDVWSDKMIELFNNPGKQKEMGQNAFREFLLKYEIKTVASNIESLYQNCKIK